jgi:hypothetical protein
MYNSYGGVSDTIDSTVEFLKKNGHIKTESLDDYQDYLDEYLKLLYNYNFIYNPYGDVFFNPIISYEIKFKKTFGMRLEVLESKLKRIEQPALTIEIIDELNKIYDDRRGARVIIYFIFRNLKWLGIILGPLISIYYNNFLGVSVGLYFIYLDLWFFTKRNLKISNFEPMGASLKFLNNYRKYFFTSLILIALTLLFIFLTYKSILFVVIFFSIHTFLFNKFLRNLMSIEFAYTSEVYDLEKKLKRNFK